MDFFKENYGWLLGLIGLTINVGVLVFSYGGLQQRVIGIGDRIIRIESILDNCLMAGKQIGCPIAEKMAEHGELEVIIERTDSEPAGESSHAV